jgi:hypothetical protein
MKLEDEKVTQNRKLRRLENQKVGGSKTCQPSYLLTFLLFTFLLSYFSKYLCLFVFIPCPPSLSLRRGGRGGFPYPHSSFLFPISVLKVLAIE